MCYSYRTSLISYTIVMLSAFFALYTGQYIIGMLILFYGQIQLSEALIWKGLDDGNTTLNKIATNYGKYTLPTHLFAIGLGILLTTKGKSYIPLVIGIFFYVFVVSFYYDNSKNELTYPLDRNCRKECQNNDNRLQWPFYDGELWYGYSCIIGFIFICMYLPTNSQKIMITMILALTYLFSFLFYKNNTKSLASVWCFSSAIIAPIIVLAGYYLKNYTR